MAEPYIWGNLARANNDATLIDEAIGVAINAHNDNPDAHLGDDQALQSHRAAEIIDHLAESVVNDKIRVGARAYVAVVGTEPGDDYDNLEDAVDYAWSKGGGSIKIRKGVYQPTRDLKVRYGVDIYGEGPLETIIDMDEHGLRALNFAQNYKLEVLLKPTISTREGEGDAEVLNNDIIDPEWLTDVYYVGIPTLMGEDGYFGPSSFYGSVYLADLAEYEDIYSDVDIQPTLTATDGSDIVHVNGWQLCSGFEEFQGYMLQTSGGSWGIVEEYLGDGDFRLMEPVTGSTSRDIGIMVSGDAGRMSIVQGVTIEARDTEYLMRVDAGKGRVFFRDTTIQLGTGLFEYPDYFSTIIGGGVRFENTVIYCNASSTNFWVSGATFRNCAITWSGGVNLYDLGGSGVVFENCSFGNGLGGSIANIQHYTSFQNCGFANCVSGTIQVGGASSGTIPQPHVFFNSCDFHTLGYSGISFYGYGLIFVGCFFYNPPGTVGLHSSSRYSTMSCCVFKSTIGTAPTNCVMVGNIAMA